MDEKEMIYQYHTEEYKARVAEIERLAKEISSTEINFTLAAAAVYAWLATGYTQYHLPRLVWSIPVLLTLLGLVKVAVCIWTVQLNAKYVKSLEKKYLGEGSPDTNGWEHFLRQPDRPLWKQRLYYYHQFIYWIAFLFVTGAVAFRAPPLFEKRGDTAAAETKVVFAGKAEKVEVYPGKQASAAGADSKVLSAEKAEKVEVYLVPQPPSLPR